MNPIMIKDFLNEAIFNTASHIHDFTTSTSKVFVRNRKLPAPTLISYLISQGASSTRNEIMDYFSFDLQKPSLSALSQQRAKLSDRALRDVLVNFNHAVESTFSFYKYRLLAADGSTFTFDSYDRFCSEEYHVSSGHSSNGFYSMHLNAFFDLQNEIYTDAIIQPVHLKDEYSAFCKIVDRHPTSSDYKNIYIGDRGYCSYNNMAHVIESGQYFLFRAKDFSSKGIVKNYPLPVTNTFDVDVDATLIRSHSKKLKCNHSQKRFINKASSFDYVEYGSLDTYDISFRIVRIEIAEGIYECLLTNLPREIFTTDMLKELYNLRWGIESSYRKLKYTIGLCNFHSYKPAYIMQEIWAKMIVYNATQMIINSIEPNYDQKSKHSYKISFSCATHICRIFLRLTTKKDSIDVVGLLSREIIPIRNNRKYPRLQTAHFRRPRHAVYRAA